MFVRSGRAKDRAAVSDLFGTGMSDYEISRRTGVSRSSVQRWRTHGFPRDSGRPDCGDWRPPDAARYSYLLGIYLGDGYVSKASTSPVLEISLDSLYPGIARECAHAIAVIGETPAKLRRRRTDRGYSLRVSAGGRIWPLAFPQHGPGKKHERPIVLAPWQQEIVTWLPRPFLRGLIHSDGSRSINRFSVSLASGTREYAYPRYFFTNLSSEIRILFCEACERIGINWTQSSPKNISIADRRSVEILDSFVGPKF